MGKVANRVAPETGAVHRHLYFGTLEYPKRTQKQYII